MQSDAAANNEAANSVLDLNIIREPAFTPMTPRKRSICSDFGLASREEPAILARDVRLQLRPGQITLVTGPSGCGKSSLLRAIAEQVPVVWSDVRRFPTNGSVIDGVAPRQSLAHATQLLTACGLGEPRHWIRRITDLSDGERFRAALARAIARAMKARTYSPILCDEFAALLHERLAATLCFNLRRLVTRHRLCLFVASPREEIRSALHPDVIIRLNGRAAEITSPAAPRRPRTAPLRRHLAIDRGRLSDYRSFGEMHYRTRDSLGFVDRVFLLRDRRRDEALGILVFAHGSLELALRNRATAGRFVRRPRLLNRELRILRRLVIHPDLRGCGLAHWFVRRTLPQVGVRFVECLAAMGDANPVFERAGMKRVGACPPPRGRLRLLQRMQHLGIDPFNDAFAHQIARYPRVRRFVVETIEAWVRAMQGGAQLNVRAKQPADLARTFQQVCSRPPVYYLWDRESEFPRPNSTPDHQFNDEQVSKEHAGVAHDLEKHATSVRHNPARRHSAQRRQPASARASTCSDPATTRTTRGTDRHRPDAGPRRPVTRPPRPRRSTP